VSGADARFTRRSGSITRVSSGRCSEASECARALVVGRSTNPGSIAASTAPRVPEARHLRMDPRASPPGHDRPRTTLRTCIGLGALQRSGAVAEIIIASATPSAQARLGNVLSVPRSKRRHEHTQFRFALDSPLEGTRFEPSVPPTRFFRERPRFSSISSARLAIPWSRVPMRVGRVPMLPRARPAAVRPN
jgi:hypothetical protein